MTNPEPGSDAWLNLVSEEIIDPDRPIVDPHHHLWDRAWGRYLLDELWADTGSGHNVVTTVYLECGSSFYSSGPVHLKPVGESVFVNEIAAASRANPDQPSIGAIVGRADLSLGAELDEVLEAHEAAAPGLFRGIRHTGARARHPQTLRIALSAPEGLYQDESFRRGVARLGELGYTYDAWHYHHQNQDFLTLARAVPGTPTWWPSWAGSPCPTPASDGTNETGRPPQTSSRTPRRVITTMRSGASARSVACSRAISR